MKFLDTVVALWFAVCCLATFLVFGWDKWRAGRSGQRVPERTLVILAALGGWLGGWLAMQLFRHKTIKRTFKLKYALALVPFAAEVWAWWHWR